jgi:hypothetical protein
MATDLVTKPMSAVSPFGLQLPAFENPFAAAPGAKISRQAARGNLALSACGDGGRQAYRASIATPAGRSRRVIMRQPHCQVDTVSG